MNVHDVRDTKYLDIHSYLIYFVDICVFLLLFEHDIHYGGFVDAISWWCVGFLHFHMNINVV